MEIVDKLKKAKNSIEEALNYISKAKRSSDDETTRRLKYSENELQAALKSIKDSIKELS